MKPLLPGEYDIVLNGLRLHYTVAGAGPPLVAHSGGPGFDARSWDEFAGIDQFTTIIALHPRGTGLSEDARDGAYRLADCAADLAALIHYLELEQPVVLGWSHGGIVAQQFAITSPDALSKLILFDTSARLTGFLMISTRLCRHSRTNPGLSKPTMPYKRCGPANTRRVKIWAACGRMK